MIIYIFNNYLHDNAGFSKRCRREIEILSKNNEIVVISRSKNNKQFELYKTQFQNVKVHYYKPILENNRRFDKYQFPGLLELIRNLDLFFAFSITLIKILWQNRKHKNYLYTVVSPLTVPLISMFWGILFKTKLQIVEFHDLEPELAMHIKNLKVNSLIVKIELWLEKFICRSFNKIIVTAESQGNVLIERTGINSNKIIFIPNSLHSTNLLTQSENLNKFKNEYNLEGKFIVSVISSYNYDYTVNGVIRFTHNLENLIEKIPNLAILIIGGGEGLNVLKQEVEKTNFNKRIVFTGRIPNVSDFVKLTNVCLIPWEHSRLSESILPSKLFDYMIAKRPIVAPNFGEFKETLEHKKNAYLYDTYEELNKYIIMIKEDEKATKILSQHAYKLFIDKYEPKIYEEVLEKLI